MKVLFAYAGRETSSSDTRSVVDTTVKNVTSRFIFTRVDTLTLPPSSKLSQDQKDQLRGADVAILITPPIDLDELIKLSQIVEGCNPNLQVGNWNPENGSDPLVEILEETISSFSSRDPPYSSRLLREMQMRKGARYRYLIPMTIYLDGHGGVDIATTDEEIRSLGMTVKGVKITPHF